MNVGSEPGRCPRERVRHAEDLTGWVPPTGRGAQPRARAVACALMSDASTPQIRKAWDMVDQAKSEIENLSVEQVKAELDAGTAVIVDIRDFRELYLKGKVPGAFHCDRGMLEFWVDPQSEYYRDTFTPDRRYILYCAAGGRSALTAKTMKDMGYPNVAHMEEGFGGWEQAAMPVEDCKAGAKWVLRSDVEGR